MDIYTSDGEEADSDEGLFLTFEPKGGNIITLNIRKKDKRWFDFIYFEID
jgi:hypothetical protein